MAIISCIRLKILTDLIMVKHSWCGINTLNYSLSETGTHLLIKMPFLILKDLKFVSFLYFIHVNTYFNGFEGGYTIKILS
jgi:hypothetical protein